MPAIRDLEMDEWVLGIVFFQIKLELFRGLRHMDAGGDTLISFAQHRQHRFIDIIVDEIDGFFSTADKSAGQ